MKFSGLQLIVAENSPSAAPAISAAACTDQLQLQQTVIATVAGKELTDNGENINGKRSPHEESDLQEWYETFLIQAKRKATQISKKHLFVS
jgi:hypothetical protein